jgi:hypothetical protein
MPTQANLALRPVATSMTIARCCVWYLIAWGKSPSAWCAFPSVLWIAPTRPGSTQDPLALRETFHRRSSTTPSAWRLTRRWATGRGRAGRTGTSVARTSRCLAIAKEVGNRAGEGGAHGGLGNAHDSLGDFSPGDQVPHAAPGDCQGGGRQGGGGRGVREPRERARFAGGLFQGTVDFVVAQIRVQIRV